MANHDEPVPVAVLGVGRMGQHHARIYRHLPNAKLVAVVDPDRQRCHRVAEKYGCEPCMDDQDLLARHPQIRAVSVAVPTADHASVAAPMLRKGIACLIEKPLAPDVQQAQAVTQMAADHGALLQVGHTERFNPAIRAVNQMKITPRFVEVDRVSPMTFRSLDVGVVMDLMIHDLDIVQMLAQSKLAKVDAVGVSVLGAHEDVVNARIVFASGCVANLTASRLALKTARKLRIFSDEAYISLDYQSRKGVVVRKSPNAAALDQLREQIAQGKDLSALDYAKLVHVEPLGTNDDDRASDDPLTAELTSFLEAVDTGRTPEVDGPAACAAVDAAQQVVDALRKHRWEGLADPRP